MCDLSQPQRPWLSHSFHVIQRVSWCFFCSSPTPPNTTTNTSACRTTDTSGAIDLVLQCTFALPECWNCVSFCHHRTRRALPVRACQSPHLSESATSFTLDAADRSVRSFFPHNISTCRDSLARPRPRARTHNPTKFATIDEQAQTGRPSPLPLPLLPGISIFGSPSPAPGASRARLSQLARTWESVLISGLLPRGDREGDRVVSKRGQAVIWPRR